MKRLPTMLAAFLAVTFFSCNSGTEKTEDKTADTTAAVVAPAPEKPTFEPFKVVSISHKVKNFAKWEEQYFAHDSVRKAYGITHYEIGRDLKDSNLVYIVDKMEDMAKAKTFSTLPNLKDAMKKAGVISQPGFSYAEVIRNDDSPTEYADRVGVAHHVKDFAAWLKVFDAEGPATRAANGLVDRVMARSLVDSNMVYLTFAVSDMAKAKARVTSPDLKKIMTDAGVDSPPTVRWFRIVK
jgi:quinol monooxygenase YgiN